MKVDFVLIETTGTHEVLACPTCGNIFEIDIHEKFNLVYDKAYMGWLAKCPDCSSIQKGDD